MGGAGHCSITGRRRGATCGAPWRPRRSMRCVASPGTPSYDAPVPLDCDAAEIEPLVEPRCMPVWPRPACGWLAVRSRAIFAEEFNELVERHGSKGAALSHRRSPWPPDDRTAAGRPDLGDLRQARRAEPLRAVAGRPFSRVAHRGPRRRAASRASIASARPSGGSKSASARRPNRVCRPRWRRWPRSISASWPCGRSTTFGAAACRGLQPTAGYPQDAKRFRADIAETQQKLHIADRVLWRVK